MILVHFKDGRTACLDPVIDADLKHLDPPFDYRAIRRVAILGKNSCRVDLPKCKNGTTRIWIERVVRKNEIRGERVCMRRGRLIIKATYYYSDNHIVLDLS